MQHCALSSIYTGCSMPGLPVLHHLRVCSNSHSPNWWCYPIISFPVVPFSYCLQSVPASGSFPMSWLFTSGGQNSGASASASVLPLNIQGWFPLWLNGFISLLSKGPSSLLQHHSSKESILRHSAFLMVRLSHLYMTAEKTVTIKTSVSKVISLLYNTLSRFVRAFLPRSTCLNFMANKTCYCFHCFPIYLWWDWMPWA